MEIEFMLFGVICVLCGIGCLYLSWKSRVQLRDTFTMVGCIMIATAGFNWLAYSISLQP